MLLILSMSIRDVLSLGARAFIIALSQLVIKLRNFYSNLTKIILLKTTGFCSATAEGWFVIKLQWPRDTCLYNPISNKETRNYNECWFNYLWCIWSTVWLIIFRKRLNERLCSGFNSFTSNNKNSHSSTFDKQQIILPANRLARENQEYKQIENASYHFCKNIYSCFREGWGFCGCYSFIFPMRGDILGLKNKSQWYIYGSVEFKFTYIWLYLHLLENKPHIYLYWGVISAMP